jgi:hypothetical protein
LAIAQSTASVSEAFECTWWHDFWQRPKVSTVKFMLHRKPITSEERHQLHLYLFLQYRESIMTTKTNKKILIMFLLVNCHRFMISIISNFARILMILWFFHKMSLSGAVIHSTPLSCFSLSILLFSLERINMCKCVLYIIFSFWLLE